MLATTQLDLASLLSPDNATRNTAEQALDALQASQPQVVVSQLCGTLADGAADPMARTLCAILLRRRLPGMLPSLSEEWRGSVKAKLLEALSSPCDRSLRTKVCDTVGRLGIEFHAEGRWPELMQFIQHSCSAGEPTALLPPERSSDSALASDDDACFSSRSRMMIVSSMVFICSSMVGAWTFFHVCSSTSCRPWQSA